MNFHLPRITVAVAMCFACLDDHCLAQSTSKVTDMDGNVYSVKILDDNLIWMTDNMNLNIPGSYCYENIDTNCRKYGRLYTWTAAVKACELLGDGWRLPTNVEWQYMAQFYGGVLGHSADSARSTYAALLPGGRSAFNAAFGGGRDPGNGGFARLDAHGFYWTATEIDTANAWFYNLGKGLRMLNRHDGERIELFPFVAYAIREIRIASVHHVTLLNKIFNAIDRLGALS